MTEKKLVLFNQDKKSLSSEPGAWQLISSPKEFADYLQSSSQVPPIFSAGLFDVTSDEWKGVVDLYLTYHLLKKDIAKKALDVRIDWLDETHVADFVDPSENPKIETSHQGHHPQFSIVIPFRNRPAEMTFVLKSLSQLSDENPFEVVLVNDGSSDESLQLLRAELSKLNLSWTLVTLFPSPLFRAGIARNAGVRVARADDLIFLDSDIVVAPDFLVRTREALSKADFAQGRRWQIWRDQWGLASDLLKIPKVEPNPFWVEFQTSETPWKDLSQPWKYVSTFCLAVRKKDFLEIGGFRLWYSDYGFEDTDLGLRLCRIGKTPERILSDVFHLSPRLKGEPYEAQQRARLKRSARKYFLINQSVESLNWLIYMMM